MYKAEFTNSFKDTRTSQEVSVKVYRFLKAKDAREAKRVYKTMSKVYTQAHRLTNEKTGRELRV